MFLNKHGYRPLWSRQFSRLLLPALLLLVGSRHANAQTDFLTFTGVWSAVPVAGLSNATGITGDAAGNLYITDFNASSILKVAPDGTQSTVGSGLSDPDGVAIDSSNNLYVTSNSDNKVYKITSAGSQTQVGSGWSSPVSVAVDSTGNVFVTDSDGLSEVTAGGTQSLVIANGSLQGVTVDLNDNVYYGNNGTERVVELLAGTTSATDHNVVPYVRNLYVDAQGNVYNAGTESGVQRADDGLSDTTTFGDTLITVGVWGNAQSLYLLDSSGAVEKLALGAVDFGAANLCNTSNTVTPCSSVETLHFALDSIVFASPASRVVTQGFTGADFQLTTDSCSTNLNDGGTCSMTVTFTPQGAGFRPGAAQAIGSTTVDLIAHPVGPHPQTVDPAHAPRPLDQPAGTLLTSVLLHGTGVGPLGVFNTAPIQTFFAGTPSSSYPNGVILSVFGGLYVVDSTTCTVQLHYGNNVITVAGTACGGASGDGGPANMAVFENPARIVLDGAGNLFICDYAAQTVRKVDGLTGIITTVAGNGTLGYSGDGGLATNAMLYHPAALALDPSGNLFIADSANSRVRKVDGRTGIITTVAGNGTMGYSGDGGPGIAAQLRYPFALTFDAAGNLYIADNGNSVIRKLTAGVISTIAGNGTFGYSGDGGPAISAQLNDPEGVSTDPAGNVYIADSSNFLVRKVDGGTGVITTAAGTFNGTQRQDERYTGDGGPAIQAGMSYTQDVFVDQYDEIVIADADNAAVRVVISPVAVANFGTVALGSASAEQPVIMSNAGLSSLTLNNFQVPTDYSLVPANTTCNPGTILAVNASCAFSVQLAPTIAGSRNNALVIQDDFYNYLNDTQVIILSGAGVGAAPVQLAFTAPVPTIVTGGNPGVVAINIEASDSSVVTGATSLVTLTITGPGDFSDIITVAAVNGVATFDLSSLPLVTTGAYTFTATAANVTQALANVSVIANTPGPAQLVIPSSVTATISVGGNPGIVPVRIENSSAAVVTSATNPVTLTVTGPGGYSHVVTVAAIYGIAGFDLSALAFTTPGVYVLTATSNGLAPATATVTVAAASVPGELAIAASLPAVVPSGGSLGIVPVTINNQFGNLAIGATNMVTLTITGPNGFSHIVSVAAVNGVASFDLSGLILDTTGVYTLTATSAGLTQAVATVTVTVGSVTTQPVQLSIPPSVPAMLASGGDLGIVPVIIENSSGMVIPGAANTVTLTINGPDGFTYTLTSVAVNGVASFDLTSVVFTTPGVYTLTATSGRLTQALASVTISTDFTIAASRATAGPVPPGAAAAFTFMLAPASGAFPAPITLTATGLPPGATFSFSPATVTPGSSAVNTAMSIQTLRSATAALHQQPPGGWGWGTLALGLLLLPISNARRMRTVFRRTPLLSSALLLLSLGTLAGLAGCGAGGLFGHVQQSYNITVTGTSGAIHHSATVTLTVE